MFNDLNELNAFIAKTRRSPQLGRIFTLFMSEDQAALNASTREKIRKIYLSQLAVFDRVRADQLTPLMVEHQVLKDLFAAEHYYSVAAAAQFLIQLLDFAEAVGVLNVNPLAKLNRLTIVRRAHKLIAQRRQHRPTLDFMHLERELLKVLASFEKGGSLRRILLLEINLRTILRPGECVKLKISDLNVARHELSVHHTKTKDLFIIPTCAELEEALLCAYQAFGSESGWIFAGGRDHAGHLSSQCLNRALKDYGWQNELCAHGLRSIAANFFAAHSRQVLPHVAASCLQHAVGSAVERAYRRDKDYLADRRRAMQLWNDFLSSLYQRCRKTLAQV